MIAAWTLVSKIYVPAAFKLRKARKQNNVLVTRMQATANHHMIVSRKVRSQSASRSIVLTD